MTKKDNSMFETAGQYVTAMRPIPEECSSGAATLATEAVNLTNLFVSRG